MIDFLNVIGDFFRTYGSAIIAIAALFAVFLTDRLNKRRERKSRDEQIHSVRILIGLEIEKNLETLSELCINVNNLNGDDLLDKDDHEDYNKINLAYKLLDLTLPPLTNESWKSQLSFVPIALSENEIKNVNSFYTDLYTIKSIYASLLSVFNQHQENFNVDQLRPKDKFSFIQFSRNVFNESAPSLWEKFEKITRKLLKNGNPIIKES